MSDLAAFLRARLDEDEATAKGTASSSPWTVSDVNDDGTSDVESADAPDGLWHGWVAGHIAGGDANHIARHDPARVLLEVAAKRAILGWHPAERMRYIDASRCPQCELTWPCPTVRHLAAVYQDHPDYRQEWAL